eukprot:GHVU01074453.1.p1 GENE.GHVU01074453.1~~GHVU01074453.1.p1  ORF type:complete len:129 (+),score=16.30 GHVU01074453.1:510-896(+)
MRRRFQEAPRLSLTLHLPLSPPRPSPLSLTFSLPSLPSVPPSFPRSRPSDSSRSSRTSGCAGLLVAEGSAACGAEGGMASSSCWKNRFSGIIPPASGPPPEAAGAPLPAAAVVVAEPASPAAAVECVA